jgi:dihydroneopterin aldolase
LPDANPWTKPMSNIVDKILISSIDCVAAIGVTPEERTIKQRLSIDVEVLTDASRAARSDSLKDAIDYSKIATLVMEVCRSRDFHLIETLAELLADRILAEFPTPQSRVLVRKISPIVEPRVRYVSIEIVRSR